MKKGKFGTIMCYAALGTILATAGTNIALQIYDEHIDHTKEVCPITHILNVIPREWINSSEPVGVLYHQSPKVTVECLQNGKNVITSYDSKTDEMSISYLDRNSYEVVGEKKLKIR